MLKVGKFDLGDRVVSVGGHPNAPPFGTPGTVVAVHPNGLVECVFDCAYLGGKDLYGRCKKGTGNIVPPFCLVNKTRPVDLARAKLSDASAHVKATAKAQEERKRAEPKHQNQGQQGKKKGNGNGGGAAKKVVKIEKKPKVAMEKQADKMANAGATLLKMLQSSTIKE